MNYILQTPVESEQQPAFNEKNNKQPVAFDDTLSWNEGNRTSDIYRVMSGQAVITNVQQPVERRRLMNKKSLQNQ